MTEPLLIGIDDGYADTKIASSAGCLVIPSRGVRLLDGQSGVPALQHKGFSATYVVDGERIFVDPTISGDDTRTEGFHTSDLNVALVQHALRAAKFSGQSVVVAAGLPLGSYYDAEGQVNWDLVEAKRSSLLRPVLVEGDGQSCEITDVHVYPQTVSAWIGTVLDSKGRMQQAGGPVAVVDIGGRTTDFAVILPPNRIDPARSASMNLGIVDVHDAVRQHLAGLGIDAPAPLVQIAVRSGSYPNGEQVLDLREVVGRAKHELGERITEAARRLLGAGDELESVLFVGGGYNAMQWVSRAFDNAKPVESPAYANARGMWKYLKYVQYAKFN